MNFSIPTDREHKTKLKATEQTLKKEKQKLDKRGCRGTPTVKFKW